MTCACGFLRVKGGCASDLVGICWITNDYVGYNALESVTRSLGASSF